MKQCSSCKESKELTEFYPDKRTSSGVFYSCKSCCSAENKERWKKKGKEYYLTKKAWLQKHRTEHPEQHLLILARYRAKKKGVEFNIDISDIPVPEICPVLGIKLVRAPDAKNQWSCPTIDRIKPELGYVKGNVKIISHRANTIKNSGTIEEHEKIIKYMKENP